MSTAQQHIDNDSTTSGKGHGLGNGRLVDGDAGTLEYDAPRPSLTKLAHTRLVETQKRKKKNIYINYRHIREC